MSRLLLVDDNESSRVSLGILLEDEGFEVVTAASFAAARELLSVPSAAYDAVLLDQHLGDGLGTSLLPLLRERLPRAAAVLISGSASEEDVAKIGVDAVIPKCTRFPDLLVIVQWALARAARGDDGGPPQTPG